MAGQTDVCLEMFLSWCIIEPLLLPMPSITLLYKLPSPFSYTHAYIVLFVMG